MEFFIDLFFNNEEQIIHVYPIDGAEVVNGLFT